jgi:hypothetical protein
MSIPSNKDLIEISDTMLLEHLDKAIDVLVGNVSLTGDGETLTLPEIIANLKYGNRSIANLNKAKNAISLAKKHLDNIDKELDLYISRVKHGAGIKHSGTNSFSGVRDRES